MNKKVCLVGLGSIGALKPDDIDFNGSTNILTHANAITVHQETTLHAVIDKSTEKLKAVTKKWYPENCFNTVEQMYAVLQTDPPDIVIVATPTNTHYQVINDILKYSGKNQPKLIIAEKPFCSNTKETQTIIQECDQRNIPIMIDYIRRFSDGHKEIKKYTESEKFGKVQNVRIAYTRGWHDCCHAVDICRYFFGDCLNAEILNRNGINDRDPNDLTYDYKMSFEKCSNVVFQGCDGRKFGIFEIDIVFDKARIRLIDNGLQYEIYPVAERNEWGHPAMEYSLSSVIRQETGLNTSLYGLIDNAVSTIRGESKPLCSGSDALHVHLIKDSIGT